MKSFKLLMFCLVVILILSGCSTGSTEETTEETIGETSDYDISETDVSKSSNFDFLKINAVNNFDEEHFRNFDGYFSSYNGFRDFVTTFDNVVTDLNEIEYAEYSKTQNKYMILDNDKYSVYIYANDINDCGEEMEDVFVINKSINAEKPTMMIQDYFDKWDVFTGEFVLKGDILWTKSLSDEAKAIKDSGELFGDNSINGFLAERWHFIDLTGKNGAFAGASFDYAILSENKEYYCIRDSIINGLEIGKTDSLVHTCFYGTMDGSDISITNSGEVFSYAYGQYWLYSINDNNKYRSGDKDKDFLYVSDDALYTLSNYGIMKYTNDGGGVVLKFTDFGPNTEVQSYFIRNGDYPQIKLKSGDKEEIINLTDY